MKESLLTIAAIARQLGLAESTVRFYRDKFSEYIPSTGEGKKKRYRPEAFDVLRFIADSLRSGKTAEQTAENLALKFAREIEVAEQTAAIAAEEPQQVDSLAKITDMIAIQTEALKQLTVILYRSYDQQQNFEAFSSELRTLSDEVIFLRKKLEDEKNQKKDKADLEEKSKELTEAKTALSRANSALKELVQYKQDAEQKAKDLLDQQAENERLQAENEKLSRSWWRRLLSR